MPQCYFVATVIEIQPLCTQICEYKHILHNTDQLIR
jgi:hypothetical protein